MSKILKEPKRKKYHNKRALIHKAEKYAKQYKYARKRSIIYQNTLLYSFGPEMMYLNSWVALERAIQKFNEMYGDQLHFKHAVLLLVIKHYTVTSRKPDFLTSEIFEYYPSMKFFLSYYGGSVRGLGELVADLYNMHFLNPINRRYIVTTRVKIFTAMMDKELKALYSQVE